MKKTLLVFLIMAIVGFASLSYAASSCTVREKARVGESVVIEYSWTAHTDGTFTSSTCTNPRPINGWITHIETDPGATAPTALYDITLTNDVGYDVAEGGLMNRSDTAVESDTYGGYPVFGALTLNISNNAVNGATGIIRLFVIPFKKD